MFSQLDDRFVLSLPLETLSKLSAAGRMAPAKPDSGGNTPEFAI